MPFKWLRGRIARPNLSLRTELILLLGTLVLLATASLGSIAFNTSRAIVEEGAVRAVGVVANARKQALIRFLSDQRVRAAALLGTLSVGCAPDEVICIRRILTGFAASEGANAFQLAYQNRPPIIVGDAGVPFRESDAPTGDQIARFVSDQTRRYYVIQVRNVLRDGEMVSTLRADMDGVNSIFSDRYGLGESGETFLIDARGVFLTPSRYPTPDGEFHPNEGEALRTCLQGNSSEVLGLGYRGVPVIQGFRYIPEIGGGCVMVHMDQTEAFAPTTRLRVQLIRVSILLGIIAISCSILFTQLVSRPINRLRDRARSLQAGDFDSPVPEKGFAEVRMFAQTFAAMAFSLRNSRKELEKSSEQITSILESIRDGFIALDRDWRCLYINHVAITLSRSPREQLIGKNLSGWFAKNLSSPAFAQLERGMRERTGVHFEEYYAPFDSWFEVDASPTGDGLAVFVRDVTERKRFSERLQQTQRLESLGVLAGGIAHDFNNLLTGIIGNASLALEESPPKPMRGWLQAVMSAGEQATALTRQLLAYAGKGPFVTQPLNLSELVRETSHLVQTSIPRTVHLRLQLAENLPAVEGDVAQLQQVIMNLVINGAEAIGDGRTGSVTVTTCLQQIDQIYIQQTFTPEEISPGAYIVLEVTDTGCGMDEATVSRIFEPFFTTKFTGRGLGLAAAIGIVRRHKGTLKVYSVPAQGSSFKILIPASTREAADSPLKRTVQSPGGTETILVIDDEEVVQRAARSTLERLGYTVILAEDGAKGIQRCRESGARISLVLLDLTMPGMPGEEVLERLEAMRPDLPVILSSGFNQMEVTRRLSGKGPASFLQKPYTARQLAEQVRSVLDEFARPRDPHKRWGTE
ncbi:MAG TPA: response regulator, partial [Terriglobia bacterium]|nr:response regulator [Terriglobia bacterium]